MIMVTGVEVQGSTVVSLVCSEFGRGTPAPRPFGAANDNGPKDPVNTVTIRKTLDKSGVAIKIKVPVSEFVGVAVSTTISEQGVLTSAIELVHGDPDLNYRVFEEVGNGNVVAEWQNWGKKLRLPLFIRSGDGALLPYSQQVDGLLVGASSGRRKLSVEAGRRVRFLTRRKPGGNEGV